MTSLKNTPQRPKNRQPKAATASDSELVQRRQHLLEQSKKAERIGELTRAATLLEELLSITEDGISSPSIPRSNGTHPVSSPGATKTMLERRIEQLRRRAEVRVSTRKREAREKKIRAARAIKEKKMAEEKRLAEEARRAEAARIRE
jgi:hypothetical protein